MIRIAATGKEGQVVRSLTEWAPKLGVEIVLAGRPELDLAVTGSILPALDAARPDIIINTAAYTAVDLAEKEPELAMRINGAGAGEVARAAHQLGVPIIQISTDYIFNGKKPTPYLEQDDVSPLNVYGLSKLAGEKAVAEAAPDHAILRTSWVYAPFGKNFVLNMLRLAETRSELRVIADQFGSPTYAPDLAAALIKVASNLLVNPSEERLRGLFHLTGSGETNWAEFASTLFTEAKVFGVKAPVIIPITTAEYPTPAKRPTNSRLDCSKLELAHQVRMPFWKDSLHICISRLLGSSI
jgi:dTDP-4-dehydrorhamnose reductase